MRRPLSQLIVLGLALGTLASLASAAPLVTRGRERAVSALVDRIAGERRLGGSEHLLWRHNLTQILVDRSARLGVPVARIQSLGARPGALTVEDLTALFPQVEPGSSWLSRKGKLAEGMPGKLARAWKPYANARVFARAYLCQKKLSYLLTTFEQGGGVTLDGSHLLLGGSLAKGCFTAWSDVDVAFEPAPGPGGLKHPPPRNLTIGIERSLIYDRLKDWVDFIGIAPSTPGDKLAHALTPALFDDGFAPKLLQPLPAQRGTSYRAVTREPERRVTSRAVQNDPHLVARTLRQTLVRAGLDAELLEAAQQQAFGRTER